MFGQQSLSQRQSGAAYGFGSATREIQGKVFMSQEHAKLSGHPNSPGPAAYQMLNSVGKQFDGRKASAPLWQFGSSARFAVDKRLPFPGPGTYGAPSAIGGQVASNRTSQPIYGFGSANRENASKVFISPEHAKTQFGGLVSPGPTTAHDMTSAVGKQINSKKVQLPAWGFGTQKRFQYDHVKRAMGTPGPGQYAPVNAVGAQVLSNKPTSSVFGFGTSTRGDQSKVYLSAEHEKYDAGRNSPGVFYDLQGSIARQVDSKYNSRPSWGFGTSARWAHEASARSVNRLLVPGPGAYNI